MWGEKKERAFSSIYVCIMMRVLSIQITQLVHVSSRLTKKKKKMFQMTE